MNYIKYLSDSRLINIIYTVGQEFPKKPAKVIMNNSNLIYAIYPIHVEQQDVMETFFVNALLSGHLVNEGNKQGNYIIDENKRFRICDAENTKMRLNNETIYARYNTEVGKDNKIPLWLFGFLYWYEAWSASTKQNYNINIVKEEFDIKQAYTKQTKNIIETFNK